MDNDSEPVEQDPRSFLLLSVALELGLGVVALVLGGIFGPDPRDVVPQLGEIGQLARGLGWGLLAALPMLVAIQLLERLPIEPVRKLQKETEERLVALMAAYTLPELGVISLCAGVGEEMLFRGWLMMSLAGPAPEWQTPTLVLAVVISSIAFGLAHPITPAYVVVTGVIGVYLALLLVWTGNLLVPVTAHAFYDFVQLVFITRGARRDKEISGRGSRQ